MNGAATSARREAYFLHYAERLRERCTVPLMLTGGFRTRAVMEQVLTDGSVDVIGLARPLAIHPDLPARLLTGADTPPLPVPPRIDAGRWSVPLNAYLELAWHGGYFRAIAQGRTVAPMSFRRALSTALLRTAYLTVTQS
jgi:hypothetical protein